MPITQSAAPAQRLASSSLQMPLLHVPLGQSVSAAQLAQVFCAQRPVSHSMSSTQASPMASLQ